MYNLHLSWTNCRVYTKLHLFIKNISLNCLNIKICLFTLIISASSPAQHSTGIRKGKKGFYFWVPTPPKAGAFTWCIVMHHQPLGWIVQLCKKSKQKNSQYKKPACLEAGKLTFESSHVSGIDILTLFAFSRFYPYPLNHRFPGT